MDRAPNLHDIPSQTKDKPAPAGTPFDYKEIAREVLARGAAMDRAPSLQDIPNQTRDKPAPVGTAFDYKEMAREVLARIDQRLADLGADANTPPDESEEEEPDGSEPEFQSKTASSLMTSDDQAALVRWAWRGLIGLLLSASLVAAISFLWSHSDTAPQSVAEVVPRLDPGATTPAEKQDAGPPAAARAMADAAPAPTAPPSRTDYDKPNPAPVPSELTELMRKVDRNIAGLAQAVTDLRLAHQQATGDNAKSVEDIRASLEQMTRAMDMARVPDAQGSDQVTQARPPAQVMQARPAAQVTPAKPPAQVTQPKPPALVTQAKPPAQVAQAKPPAPQTAARRNRRYVPPYLSPSDALGFMR
jgi:hypothetical protein